MNRPYVPWYFGSGLGYYSSWRYRYGASLWGYPYYSYPYMYGAYGPYGYNSYGYSSYGYSAPARDRDDNDDDDRPTGALRLRATPRHAKVYVDGALVGTVDDFDGLTGHLVLETGPHQLELRADGYQTFSTDISVTAGRTKTERASLKRAP